MLFAKKEAAPVPNLNPWPPWPPGVPVYSCAQVFAQVQSWRLGPGPTATGRLKVQL
jgi:hypothetical protein